MKPSANNHSVCVHSAPRHAEDGSASHRSRADTVIDYSTGNLCFTIGSEDKAEWKLFVFVCVCLRGFMDTSELKVRLGQMTY